MTEQSHCITLVLLMWTLLWSLSTLCAVALSWYTDAPWLGCSAYELWYATEWIRRLGSVYICAMTGLFNIGLLLFFAVLVLELVAALRRCRVVRRLPDNEFCASHVVAYNG